MAQYEKGVGAVAILDALGTSTQSEVAISAFLEARDRVLGLLDGKTDGVQLGGRVKTFTFGDTILLTLKSETTTLPTDCRKFMAVLRKFLVDSLDRGLFFRGSVAIGEHYTDDESNTVLGPAVDDAAAWYERADWIGLHLTPHGSLRLEQWKERDSGPKDHLVIDYAVPIKGGAQQMKAVNWPKVFFVDSIAPAGSREYPREFLLSRLTARPIPAGVECKHLHTLAFFDHVVSKQRLRAKVKKA